MATAWHPEPGAVVLAANRPGVPGAARATVLKVARRHAQLEFADGRKAWRELQHLAPDSISAQPAPPQPQPAPRRSSPRRAAPAQQSAPGSPRSPPRNSVAKAAAEQSQLERKRRRSAQQAEHVEACRQHQMERSLVVTQADISQLAAGVSPAGGGTYGGGRAAPTASRRAASGAAAAATFQYYHVDPAGLQVPYSRKTCALLAAAEASGKSCVRCAPTLRRVSDATPLSCLQLRLPFVLRRLTPFGRAGCPMCRCPMQWCWRLKCDSALRPSAHGCRGRRRPV